MEWLKQKGWYRLVAVFLLTFAVLACFGRALHYEFLSDDTDNIARHPAVGAGTESLWSIWSQPYERMYIPVTYTVWRMEATLAKAVAKHQGPLLTTPFHAGNFLLHIGACCLVLLLLQAFGFSGSASLLGALCFAVHPLQTEPVCWATGLKDVLGGFLSLLALWCLISARTKAGFIAATLAAVLAMLAKPSSACLPLLGISLLFFHRQRRSTSAWLTLFGWSLAAAATLGITKSVQPIVDPFSGLEFIPKLNQRWLVASDALAFYAHKMIWPLPLSFDYGRTPESVLNGSFSHLGLLICLIGALGLILRRRPWWLVMAALYFLFSLAPVSGLVPFSFQRISTVTDRYAYLALFGLALVTAGISDHFPKVGRSAITGVILAFALLTWRSTGAWKDSDSLFTQALKSNPQSWLAHEALGGTALKRGDLGVALNHFVAEQNLQPNQPNALTMIGLTFRKAGAADKADFYLKAGNRIFVNRLLSEAQRLIDEGRMKDAERFLRVAKKFSPHRRKVIIALEALLRRQGDTNEADQLMRLLQPSPNPEQAQGPDSEIEGKGK